jgi:flagellar hook-basal body complex protein FliE
MRIPGNLSPIPLPSAPASSLTGAAAGPAQGTTGSFADALGSAISQVESAQSAARKAGDDLLFTGTGDIHTAALASQRAELSLELFQQVRNKFVSAYQEIMRMPM